MATFICFDTLPPNSLSNPVGLLIHQKTSNDRNALIPNDKCDLLSKYRMLILGYFRKKLYHHENVFGDFTIYGGRHICILGYSNIAYWKMYFQVKCWFQCLNSIMDVDICIFLRVQKTSQLKYARMTKNDMSMVSIMNYVSMCVYVSKPYCAVRPSRHQLPIVIRCCIY